MEFALIWKRLWRHRVLVALGIVVAAVLAALTVADVSVSPLAVHRKHTEFGAAHEMLYVDTTTNSIETSQNDTAGLTARAQIFARFISSGEVRSAAARRLAVPPQAIAVSGPNPDTPGSQNLQPPAQARANQLLSRGSPLSVFVDTEAAAPTITLFTQAATGEQAIKLASAVTTALAEHVRKVQSNSRSGLMAGVRDALRVVEQREDRNVSAAERRQAKRDLVKSQSVIKPLGGPVGGAVIDETGSSVALIVFVTVVLLWCVAILVLSSLARTVRRR